MSNFTTQTPNVKAINMAAYHEIDDIRVKVNVLVEVLTQYKDKGCWVDPDGVILGALIEADDQLAEASMAFERMGAK